MTTLTIRAHAIWDERFDNWESEVRDRWVYDDFLRDARYAEKWISITSLAYHRGTDAVFCGVGSFRGELLWKFDRKTQRFSPAGYRAVGGAFDAKFHRSLEICGDSLYGGTALFHDADKQFEAEGGRLVRYDIPTGAFETLAIPVERIYIQSIAMDRRRGILYGFGGFPEVFWRYDLASGQARFIAYLGSGFECGQAHCPVLDDAGRVWGTYGILRAFAYSTGPDSIRLFHYDPDADRMAFLPHGLVKTCREDKARVDTALNIGDGFLYFGTEAGALERLDPATGEATLLAVPSTNGSGRLAGLCYRPQDGLLWGATGDNGQTELFAYDPRADKLMLMRPFADAKGERPEKIHQMICTDDGTLYAGENDNETRAGYLWSCEIA